MAQSFTYYTTVTAKYIDEMRHVNNAAYIYFLEQAAWAHSAELGLDWADYKRLGVGLVVRENHITYLTDAKQGDSLAIHTWLGANDGRLRIKRKFVIVREADKVEIVRASSLYVPVKLATGKPCRMPVAFKQTYAVG